MSMIGHLKAPDGAIEKLFDIRVRAQRARDPSYRAFLARIIDAAERGDEAALPKGWSFFRPEGRAEGADIFRPGGEGY